MKTGYSGPKDWAKADRFILGKEACRTKLEQTLARGGVQGELIQGSNKPISQLTPIGAGEGGLTLLLPSLEEAQRVLIDRPGHLTLSRYPQNLYLRCQPKEVSGRHLLIPWPDGLWVYDQRADLRKDVAENSVYLRIPLPWRSKPLNLPVTDLSRRGLAFEAPEGLCPFLPGTPLPEIFLIGLPGGSRILSGVVRHVTWLKDKNRLKVGLSINDVDGQAPSAGGTPSDLGFFRRLWTGLLRSFSPAWNVGALLPESRPALKNIKGKLGTVDLLIDQTPGLAPGENPPTVVMAPGLGYSKESLCLISDRCLQLFSSQGKPLKIIRVDSPQDPYPGPEIQSFSLSNWGHDLALAIHEANHDGKSPPVLITFGLKNCAAVKLFLQDEPPHLRHWIAVGGEPSFEAMILRLSGGIDIMPTNQGEKSIECGGIHLHGPNVRSEIADFPSLYGSSGVKKMDAIQAPITWLIDPTHPNANAAGLRGVLQNSAEFPRDVRPLESDSLYPCWGTEDALQEEIALILYQSIHRGVVAMPPPPPKAKGVQKQLMMTRAQVEPPWRLLSPLFSPCDLGNPSPLTLLALHPEIADCHSQLLSETFNHMRAGFVGAGSDQIPILLESLPYVAKENAKAVIVGSTLTSLGSLSEALSSRGWNTQALLGQSEADFSWDFYSFLDGTLPGLQSLYTTHLLSPRELQDLEVAGNDWRLWSLLRGGVLSLNQAHALKLKIGERSYRLAEDLGQLALHCQSSRAGNDCRSIGARGQGIDFDSLQLPPISPSVSLQGLDLDTILAPLLFPCVGGAIGTLHQFRNALRPNGKLAFTVLDPSLDAVHLSAELLQGIRHRTTLPHYLEQFGRQQTLNAARIAGQKLVEVHLSAALGDIHLFTQASLFAAMESVGFREVAVKSVKSRGQPLLIVAEGMR